MKKINIDKKVHQGHWLDWQNTDCQVNDPLSIEGFDYIELVCANAVQAVYYYTQALGFKAVAYRGPHTGYPDDTTFVLKQNEVTLLIRSPLTMTHPLTAFLTRHGDSYRDIAFSVDSCEAFYYEAMRRGAKSAEVPTLWKDSQGSVKRAAIHTYGDTVHSIVYRHEYEGLFWPGFVAYTDVFPALPESAPVGLLRVDHVVGNVEKMEPWAHFYKEVLGFTEMVHFTDKDISTEYSALMSKVVRNGNWKIKLPINEPADGKRKSQIEEYLEYHEGPGVQHIAFATENILETVSDLRSRGINFLHVPHSYYEEVPSRVGEIKEELSEIAKLGILVDKDEDGYLLQLFTKVMQQRPTLFYEFIQREGSQGFGIGNFKALFEAIERDQESRGNL